MLTKLVNWLLILLCLILICMASAFSLFQEEKIDTALPADSKP